MKQLTMKLVVLIALVTGQRCQTLLLLNLNCAQVTTNGVTFVIDKLIKSSKVGRANATVQLTAFPHDDSLCVVALFKMYLQNTRSLRGKEKQLPQLCSPA